MNKPELTYEMASELLQYIPETGELVWKPRTDKWFTYKSFHTHWNARWAGRKIGTLGKRGYLVCNVLNKLYTVHRLVWLINHKKFPSENIDHINGNPLDNRIENLRDVSQRMNAENIRGKRKNKELPLGVFECVGTKSGKVFARLVVRGQRIYLGTFDCPDEAHEAYLQAKRKHHSGCTI